MKDYKEINEAEIISGNSNSFMKKYKEMLKIKAESLKQESNIGKKYENIKKNKYQTMSKLPVIKNSKNSNFNNIQYIKDSNNNRLNLHLSPKNNLFYFDSFLLKNEKNNFSSKNFDFKKIKSYIKIKKNSQGHKNISYNDIYFQNLYKNNKNNLNGNLTNLNRNGIVKLKNKYHINNINLNDENGKKLDNNYNSMYSLKKGVTPKYIKNIKYNHKNRSAENINSENKNDINIITRNINGQIIKIPNVIFRNDNLKEYNTNENPNLKELKTSKSEQNIFLTIKRINIINKSNFNFNSNKSSKENIKSNPNGKNFFIIYPGNNGKLIENVILTRQNWEKLPKNLKKHECNFLWTPLSIQVNYNFHKAIDQFHIVNHFEFQNEITNKRNIFINLLKHCELYNINLFSFYPLTIILPLNNDNFNIAIENFKKCYFDLPNLVEDPKNKNSNFLDKYYRNYFNVKTNLKLGNIQKLIIPKNHYATKNLWLIKRINLNRGREIKVMNDLEKIIDEINQIKSELKLKYIIIQKYIEKPLLYCGRKFDIRIWVLFTYLIKNNKFEAYVFKEGHLKASSEIFDINSLDLFIHLTNYSVQKYNKNFSKNEIGNEISFDTFQKELDKKSNGQINFKRDIFGNIIKIIGITANIAKNKINGFNRRNCFEIFGYDFILDKDYNPFLLEINTNPGYEESSPLIKMLVPRMIDDALRLTIDKTFERNDKYKNISLFPVDDYKDEENMWQKIKL